MHKSALSRSQEEIGIARRKLEEIKACRDVRQTAELWSELLMRIQRTYAKLEQGSKRTTSEGWFAAVKRLRQSDDLLKYVSEARHVDEHGVERIVARRDGSFALKAKHSGTIFIKSMTVGPSGITIDRDAAEHFDFVVEAASVTLVDVRARDGSIVPVPKRHLENAVSSTALVDIGELAVSFWEAQVAKAQTMVA